MKKTIFCLITMKKPNQLEKMSYATTNRLTPSSGTAVRYPINTFLEATLKPEDELTVYGIAKKSEHTDWKENYDVFLSELREVVEKVGAKIDKAEPLVTEYSQSQDTHTQLLKMIVDKIKNGSTLIADITFGSKDMPIILFSALTFAENFLNCDVENILYGQAKMVDNKPTDTRLCDMTGLYYLNSITNKVRCQNPDDARDFLEKLLEV